MFTNSGNTLKVCADAANPQNDEWAHPIVPVGPLQDNKVNGVGNW